MKYPILLIILLILFMSCINIKRVDEKKTESCKSITIEGIELIYIEGGEFNLGPADGEIQNDEYPAKPVRISSIYMGKFEITQGQYRQISGTNPSEFKNRENHPVENVSWYDAVEFCNTLSIRAGLEPYYSINKTDRDPGNYNDNDDLKWKVRLNSDASGFRLPTNTEWEYAARAGTSTAYYWGDTLYFNTADLYAVYSKNSMDRGQNSPDWGTHPVGTKIANPFGLYDMTGNVWEWCWDWYDEKNYTSIQHDNPTGPETGRSRVLRGGSWTDGLAKVLLPTWRLDMCPDAENRDKGFRIVLPMTGAKKNVN